MSNHVKSAAEKDLSRSLLSRASESRNTNLQSFIDSYNKQRGRDERSGFLPSELEEKRQEAIKKAKDIYQADLAKEVSGFIKAVEGAKDIYEKKVAGGAMDQLLALQQNKLKYECMSDAEIEATVKQYTLKNDLFDPHELDTIKTELRTRRAFSEQPAALQTEFNIKLNERDYRRPWRRLLPAEEIQLGEKLTSALNDGKIITKVVSESNGNSAFFTSDFTDVI